MAARVVLAMSGGGGSSGAAYPLRQQGGEVIGVFMRTGDHAALIRRRRPERSTAGRIVDTAGNVLAGHEGIEHFTVGQRKGLGFAAGQRRYVLRIVPGDNEVVVGDREELLAPGLVAAEVNWLLEAPPAAPLACQVKIRYRHTAAPGTVTALPDGSARVR